MPGSPNFVGELLILFGAFEDKFVFGLVASAGVVLAAVYMIRVFQRSMHNRGRPGGRVARDRRGCDLAAIAPLVAVIVALGIYPQLVLERTEEADRRLPRSRRSRERRGDARSSSDRVTDPLAPPAASTAPRHRLQALSPLFALARRLDRRADGRACFARASCVQRVVPAPRRAASLVAAHRPDDLDLGAGRPQSRSSRARWPRTRSRSASRCSSTSPGSPPSLLSLRARAVREAGAGEFYSLLLGVDRRHGRARRGREPDHAVRRARAAVDPAVRAVRHRAAPRAPRSSRASSTCDRLGRARPRCSTGWRSSTARPGRPTSPASPPRSATRRWRHRPAAAHRHRARRHRPRVQGVGRAVPPVDARRLPGRPHADHRVHGGRDQGGRVRRSSCASSTTRSAIAQLDWAPALAALATITIMIGNVGALAQRSLKRLLAWSGVGAGRLPARRRRGRHASSACRRRPSTSPSTC